jgi:protein TonB
VLLHGALVGGLEGWSRALRRVEAVAPAALYARLLPPPQAKQERPAPEAESVLKDTLADTEAKRPVPSPRPRTQRAPNPRGAAAPALQRAAQRKLAERLFYPPEAVARGLEGETRLLLTLDADGNVVDAEVASGSGHRILDQAAVKAAYALRRLPAAGAREMILPVVFRLQ